MQEAITEMEKGAKNSNEKNFVVNSKLGAYLRWKRDIQRSKNMLREFSHAVKEFGLDKTDEAFDDDLEIYCTNKTYKPRELLKALEIEKNHLKLLTIVSKTARTALLCDISSKGEGFYEYQTLKTLYSNNMKQGDNLYKDDFFDEWE